MAYGKYGGVAVRMLNWLNDNGIKGGPVSQPSKKEPTVTVYGMTKATMRKLPKTFEGFKVEGKIGQPDYGRNQLHDMLTAVEAAKGWKR